ncbi:MAG: hypothetical protein NTX06_02035, partial [Proteobacteria bacterium]|nr:hypothetical protein [Pseudomonadota bacterium]
SDTGAWPMFRANVARTGTTQGSCIAQKLLGKKDKSLSTLRLFRDRVLAKSSAGKQCIDLYYRYGDRLGAFCGRYPAAGGAAKYLLKACVPVIGLSVN